MGTGARIKKRRQELHISQSKLASMAGMSQSGLSTIENEKNRAMSDNLSAIASALQCSVAYLLGETNDPKAISQSYAMAASLDASADVQRSPASDDDLKFALFGSSKDITDAQFEEVKRFAQFIKERGNR